MAHLQSHGGRDELAAIPQTCRRLCCEHIGQAGNNENDPSGQSVDEPEIQIWMIFNRVHIVSV